MEPRGPAPGLLLLHVNALWGSTQTDRRLFHSSPAEVKCLDQKVRPSFNEHICIPSYPGHMLPWRWAVMAGQVSRQMRKWWEAGGLSCLVSGSIGPPLPCCVCGCLWCCPNQASQRWHTAYCSEALHGPRSTSIQAPVSLCTRAGKSQDLQNLTLFRTDVTIQLCLSLLCFTFEALSSSPAFLSSVHHSIKRPEEHADWERDRRSLQVNLQTQSFRACCSKRWNEHWSGVPP